LQEKAEVRKEYGGGKDYQREIVGCLDALSVRLLVVADKEGDLHVASDVALVCSGLAREDKSCSLDFGVVIFLADRSNATHNIVELLRRPLRMYNPEGLPSTRPSISSIWRRNSSARGPTLRRPSIISAWAVSLPTSSGSMKTVSSAFR